MGIRGDCRGPTLHVEQDMKVSTGLTLAALGAILAFAVHGHPPYINFNAVGWVLMIVGIAGMFAPPSSRRWLRRRLVVGDGRYGRTVGAPVAERPATAGPVMAGPAAGDTVAGDTVVDDGEAFEEYIIDE
jgi:hypothetical protein